MAQMNLSLDEELQSQIRQAAKIEGLNVTQWVARAAETRLGLVVDSLDSRVAVLEDEMAELKARANIESF